MNSTVRIACIDSAALPLFDKSADGVTRDGYEPEAAQLVFNRLQHRIEWVFLSWEDMIPAVRAGKVDAVWCGQGITDERSELVDFTDPYAVFNETLVVRADDSARSAADLSGYRIGAIENSTNEKLARTFAGIELVGFGGSEDVFSDMIEATRSGVIDGFVDDDVVNIPLVEKDNAFATAFIAETRNRWAVGVAPGNDELRVQINSALSDIIADGSLAATWKRWMPLLDFPLPA